MRRTRLFPARPSRMRSPPPDACRPIRDSEPGKATDARIETAKTEPPRRITRGELPVVMGRLIDQVEDPTLKAALENPANPNEPKGLGTAATRDTILPKLQKSQYVELLKGKDPPIQVTEVGLAFIAAVRRVFPGLWRSGRSGNVRGRSRRDRTRSHTGGGRSSGRRLSGADACPRARTDRGHRAVADCCR